jgi:hypothetical protein
MTKFFFKNVQGHNLPDRQVSNTQFYDFTSVSILGTHLLTTAYQLLQGNRYCINLVSVAGKPTTA